jgi:hypothetical protein
MRNRFNLPANNTFFSVENQQLQIAQIGFSAVGALLLRKLEQLISMISWKINFAKNRRMRMPSHHFPLYHVKMV